MSQAVSVFRHTLLTAAFAVGLLSPQAQAQDINAPPTEQQAQDLDKIVVTGTRVSNRSATDTAVPIDIVSPAQLERSGAPELNQALSVALPSLNFPRPGLADGTDTIRPATLRGLSPDQSLVLVNSKRRHAASLVNVNGTIGRGAAAVDLNTIPTAAVQSVEVLRDGASAQYGSDAIAGVINVLLREANEGGGATLSYGRRDTSYEVPVGPVPAGANYTAPSTIERNVTDGEVLTTSVWKGLSLGDFGFLTLTYEYKDQERTERDGYDVRQQYPLLNGAFDPREITIDRFNAWYGEPEIDQQTVFANASIDMESGARLYGWASFQDRDSRSAGFFRRANDARNVIQIYPDGFLPIIAPKVTDGSAAAGLTWNWGEWSMDSSIVWGRNEMKFTIENTLNRSQGPSSQTTFDAGGFEYSQVAFNFSGTRSFDVGPLASPLNLSAGLEARDENYAIFAGEPSSYINGGVLLAGQPTPSGAQVFPGFRPANEVDESRNAIGAYIDLEANLTDNLLGSVALRAEDYSDFGSNATGKIALRYDFNDAFALRGSVQNGFRAPSPQQQFFATTSTNFINGVPFDITTFPASDPVAVALGAKPLDAEESINVSLGVVANFGDATLTLDAYRIDIDDRIVLSENLTQTTVRNFLTAQGFIGVGGGRFFINGVDTETTGVDVVFNLPLETDSAGRFDITLIGNYNKTDVTRVPSTDTLNTIDPSIRLFDRINVLTFEKGTPKDKFGAALNWSLNRWGATLRATRYGEVLDPGTMQVVDVTLSPEVVADIEGRVEFIEGLRLAIGAENLLDQYPDPFPLSRNATGNTSFSNYAPFGRSGRLAYARLSYEF